MNKIIKEHFLNPKNLGKIKKPTHTSKYKSGFCGDMVEVYAIIRNDVIEDIKYNVFGCYAVIAAASVISEWVKDKSTESLKSLTYDHVVEMLGGDIVPEKEQCVRTALTAFLNLL